MTKNSIRATTKGTPRRQTIQQRARLIIRDTAAYDDDTRESIAAALEHRDRDLAELVASAERGETILDSLNEQRKCEARAARVVAFINSDINDYLCDALMDALIEAANRKRMPLPMFNEPEAEQVKLIAGLLAVTDGNFSLEKSARRKVAEALETILKGGNAIPDALQADIARAVNELNDFTDFDSADHIERNLDAWASREADPTGEEK